MAAIVDRANLSEPAFRDAVRAEIGASIGRLPVHGLERLPADYPGTWLARIVKLEDARRGDMERD